MKWSDLFPSVTRWWRDQGFVCLVGVSLLFLFSLILWNGGLRRRPFSWTTLKGRWWQRWGELSLLPKRKRARYGRSEGQCRSTLEALTSRPFPKERPEWLRNPETGRALECDMINHDLKLCVEYQGQQHYHYTPHFHRDSEGLHSQQTRDQVKERILRNRGYQLLVVPWSVKSGELRGFLTQALKQRGYQVIE